MHATSSQSMTTMNGSRNGTSSYQEAQGEESPTHAFESHLSIRSAGYESKEKPSNEYVLNVAFFSFLGFTLLQTGFALLAKSQAMLADSEAMFVDALTYLFNLLAERLKYRPYSKQERQLAPHVRQHRRKLRRLYLELIPPLISVSTLVCVTIITLRDSMRTLLSNEDISPSDQPSVGIMLVFSAANLLLDFVNVTCFARADQAIGLMHSASENSDERSVNHWHRSSSRSRRALPDTTGLLPSRSDEKQQERSYLTEATASIQQQQEDDHVDTDASEEGINLNMCSAWTHVCADTLRSVSVLIAASMALVWDELTSEVADAVGAIIVSFIIIFSLGPLIQGLYFTAYDIWSMSRKSPEPMQHQHGRLMIVV